MPRKSAGFNRLSKSTDSLDNILKDLQQIMSRPPWNSSSSLTSEGPQPRGGPSGQPEQPLNRQSPNVVVVTLGKDDEFVGIHNDDWDIYRKPDGRPVYHCPTSGECSWIPPRPKRHQPQIPRSPNSIYAFGSEVKTAAERPRGDLSWPPRSGRPERFSVVRDSIRVRKNDSIDPEIPKGYLELYDKDTGIISYKDPRNQVVWLTNLDSENRLYFYQVDSVTGVSQSVWSLPEVVDHDPVEASPHHGLGNPLPPRPRPSPLKIENQGSTTTLTSIKLNDGRLEVLGPSRSTLPHTRSGSGGCCWALIEVVLDPRGPEVVLICGDSASSTMDTAEAPAGCCDVNPSRNIFVCQPSSSSSCCHPAPIVNKIRSKQPSSCPDKDGTSASCDDGSAAGLRVQLRRRSTTTTERQKGPPLWEIRPGQRWIPSRPTLTPSSAAVRLTDPDSGEALLLHCGTPEAAESLFSGLCQVVALSGKGRTTAKPSPAPSPPISCRDRHQPARGDQQFHLAASSSGNSSEACSADIGAKSLQGNRRSKSFRHFKQKTTSPASGHIVVTSYDDSTIPASSRPIVQVLPLSQVPLLSTRGKSGTTSRNNNPLRRSFRKMAVNLRPKNQQQLLSSSSSREQKTPSRRSQFLLRFFDSRADEVSRRQSKEELIRKGIYKPEAVFGNHLEELPLFHNPEDPDAEENGLPVFLIICIAKIEAKMNTVGIYRINGDAASVQKIRLEVDRDNYRGLEACSDLPILASTLKLFFRELPEPLITKDIRDDITMALSKGGGQDVVAVMKAAMSTLPATSYSVLNYLMKHLRRVANDPDNKMDTKNLATVFMPNLVHSATTSRRPESILTELELNNIVVEKLIENTDLVFSF